MKKIDINIGGAKIVAEEKEFKSGRNGFGYYGVINVAGKSHRISLNIIEM
jgi:hypothetical protein